MALLHGPRVVVARMTSHASDAAQPSRPSLSVSVHGPGASIETAIEAGEATKKLLEAVQEEMGVPAGAIEWKIGSVQFKCDGCGLTRPDRPGPDECWTYRDGDDLCPACTAKEAT